MDEVLIRYCKCDLCLNQEPLLDKICKCDVMWVGLSAKKVDNVESCFPLSNDTNTGKIIDKIESESKKFSFYKTNLVKCLPLDSNLKIRYPSTSEKEMCYFNLKKELDSVKPKVVFLLGLRVADFVLSKFGVKVGKLDAEYSYNVYKIGEIFFVPIHHPSYMYVYRRKQIDNYVDSICKIIEENN